MRALERRSLLPASVGRIRTLIKKIEGYQNEIAEHRRKMEKMRGQLHAFQSRYSELYELAPVSFVTLDKKARISEINASAASLLGLRSRWLIGRPFLVFISKGDLQRFLDLLSKSARTRQQESLEMSLSVNGRHIPVHLSMRMTACGDDLAHRMTIFDLSDVKRNERDLRSALDKWVNVVRGAPDSMVTVDSAGDILFANRALWGRSEGKLVRSCILRYIPKRERPVFREHFQEVFKTGKPCVVEVSGVGGLRRSWYEFSFGPVQDIAFEKGKTRITTTIRIRDISEEKRVKERLRISGEQMREFAAGIEAVREEERKRLAREIHDELGQALTVAKLDLSWLKAKPPQNPREFRKKVDSMMVHIDNTIERMRKIVSELRPALLDDLGLIPAIEWQLSEFQQRTGISTRLEVNVEGLDLTPDRSAAVFRVVQEALTNVMRHANAKSVCVTLRKERDLLKVSVTDDGQGMKQGRVNDLKSLGIIGMRERMFRVGGEFKIHSTPGAGTRIEVVLGT